MYQSETKRKGNRLFFFRCMVSILAAAAFLGMAAAYAVEYDSFGRRDPFVPLVGIPEAGPKMDLLGVLTVDDMVLQGIIVEPDGARSVIINGQLMKEGEKKGRLSIELIGNNAVQIKIDDAEHKIMLHK